MVFFGLPILVLGFFSSLRAAEPQLPKTAESFATSEVKSNVLSYPTCAAPPEAHQEEEEKCLDQRLLLGLVRPLVDKYPAEKQRQDLTFKNFFTYGGTWAGKNRTKVPTMLPVLVYCAFNEPSGNVKFDSSTATPLGWTAGQPMSRN